MDTLRIRIELNKGRIGMPFGKFARVCEEATKFLTLLSEDLGLPNENDWLAERFENSSVDFDVRYAYPLDSARAETGRRALEMIFGETAEDLPVFARIRPDTKSQFRKMTRALDPGELMRVGVYRNSVDVPDNWFEVTRSEAREPASTPVDRHVYGEVQGVVNAFFKEHSPPYLRIRELSTGGLVKCYFKEDMYKSAVELLENREAVVFVEGWVKEDPNTGFTREIAAEDFTPAVEFDEKLVESLFGSIPDYTGDMTSEQFVEAIRGDG